MRAIVPIVAATLGLAAGTAVPDEMMPGDALVPFEDLQWAPMAPDSPAEISILWGDPATGPVGLLIRIPAGFESPLHSHSSNYHAVVIEGTHQHWIDGDDRAAVPMLGAGSYFAQASQEVHGDSNIGDDTVVAFVYFEGPVDMIPKP
jgi:quercetin dioxygenase-like cupin family protein